MKGIQYDFSASRWVLAHAAGRYLPSLYDGVLSCLSLKTLVHRALPGPQWVRLRPLMAGVCGSDLATITTHASPALSAFISFPMVLGHEVVAMVEEIGPSVTHVQVGQRVVVNPFFGCVVRGIRPLCPACQRGMTALCYNAAEGALAPGMLMGFCADEPGGWSDESLCHESQCYPVPDALSDEQAVLVEPLAVGLHAALLRPPVPGGTVLVIGGGMIAFAVLAGLDWLSTGAKIVHSLWEPFQKPLSQQFGADVSAVRDTTGTLIAHVGGRAYRPRFGPEVYVGGYDVVFDCVGSSQSMTTALHATRPGGTVVLVGAAAHLPSVDWAFIWSREISLVGSMGYGPEAILGEPVRHTFEWVFDFLDRKPLPVTQLITHRLPLTAYREAIRANLHRAQSHAIKTVFDLRTYAPATAAHSTRIRAGNESQAGVQEHGDEQCF